MMENKKSKFGLGVLVGLLVAIIIGLTAFIVYDKVLLKDNDEQVENNKDSQEKIEEISIASALVLDLYDAIMPWDYKINTDKFYHEHDKVLSSDLSEDDRIRVILSHYSYYFNNYYRFDQDIYNQTDNGDYLITKSSFEENYQKLFGSDMYFSISNEKNYGNCPAIGEYNESSYIIFTQCGDTGMPSIFQEIVKAEKTENELYIYEVVAFPEHLEESKVDLYKDIDKTILVSENEDDTTINLFAMKDKLDTYKYIFKLENDNYYFYSVERVK